MKHTTITWELICPFISVGIFIALVEAWKLGKRVFFRRHAKAYGDEDDLGGVFAAWKTQDVSASATKDLTVVV
jgi:Na+-exporting ATPase